MNEKHVADAKNCDCVVCNPKQEQQPQANKKLLEPGCHFDSHRGQYIGEAVIKLAREYGFTVYEEDEPNTKADGEFYHELWEDAEEYLQQFVPEGHYFGSDGGPDWGVWPLEVFDA